MRPYRLKEKLLSLLENQIFGDPYFSLENYALSVLKSKLANNTLSAEECHLLISGFLADRLEFGEDDEPTGDTLLIEEMIDLLSATAACRSEDSRRGK